MCSCPSARLMVMARVRVRVRARKCRFAGVGSLARSSCNFAQARYIYILDADRKQNHECVYNITQ